MLRLKAMIKRSSIYKLLRELWCGATQSDVNMNNTLELQSESLSVSRCDV